MKEDNAAQRGQDPIEDAIFILTEEAAVMEAPAQIQKRPGNLTHIYGQSL